MRTLLAFVVMTATLSTPIAAQQPRVLAALDALADQLLARKDQCPDGMGRQRLHMDGFEEPSAGQLRQPRSLKVCALLDKAERREAIVPIHYRGFDIPNKFVFGFGLDLDEYYRNLPFVGVLKPEVYKGEEDRVTLVPARDVFVTIGRGSAAQLKTTATVKEPVIAPIKAGQALPLS